jgi:nucleotide-binding universal stress UspA family protein
MSDATTAPIIVVGADGSALSIQALRWAADQARLSGARLVAVTGYEPPMTILLVPTWTEEDYAREAEAALDRTVVEALGEDPDVSVERRLVQRRPAHALTEAAEGATLLVVGSHGRGELPGMHLGSVAGYCVHHAPCPVLVFRGEHTGR